MYRWLLYLSGVSQAISISALGQSFTEGTHGRPWVALLIVGILGTLASISFYLGSCVHLRYLTKKAMDRFFNHIQHGDQTHRNWLRAECERFESQLRGFFS